MANAMIRRHLSEAEKWRAIGMVEQGTTHRQVGVVLDAHHNVITRACLWYQQYGTTIRQHGGGRQRVTTTAQGRILVIKALRSCFSTTTHLHNDLQNASGVNVSSQIMRRRLHRGGLRSRRPCIRVPLTSLRRQARLEWARDHVSLVRSTRQNWKFVLFTDESRFCLDFTDRRANVCRRAGERLQDGNIAEHDRYGCGSVMVWGSISLDGRTDLVVLNIGTLTSRRYIDEMLKTQVRLMLGRWAISLS